MSSPANSQFESKTIGCAPLTVAPPSAAGQVVFGEFGVQSSTPLKGATTLDDFVAELESEAAMAPLLAAARRDLASLIDEPQTFRALRMRAGLSQTKLADLAGTTQTYVARLEAGSLDPGTDMLARLSNALRSDEVTIFRAVRAQRAKVSNRAK